SQILMVKASIRLEAEIPQGTCSRGECRIISEYHSTFAGSDQFVGIETETTQRTETTTAPPGAVPGFPPSQVLRSCYFGRFFDYCQPMLLGYFQQRIHVHGMSINVHRHDGARAASNLSFNLLNIHAPGVRIAIDKNRHTAVLNDGQGTRNNSERRH